jgi:predicted transcriptional regulator
MTRLSIQLPDDITRQAERLARERGASIDQIIREALEAKLQDPHDLSKGLDEREVLNGRRVITPEMALQMRCPFPYPEPDL